MYRILPKNKNKQPHPSKIKAHGAEGERIVRSRLSRLNMEVEFAKEIDDIIFVDSKGNSHQIDHILIRPNGVFAIETKNWAGRILGREDDDHWSIMLNRKLYLQYNPVRQNKAHCEQVRRIIGEKYHVNSVVAMMQNNGKKLNIPGVVNGCSLRRYIREFDDGTVLSKDEIDIIYYELIEASSNMSLEEHIENIKNKA